MSDEPPGGDLPDSERDPLFDAAYRTARMRALLSSRTLADDLGVLPEHAARLLAQLEQAGAVGPSRIGGGGARESRVSIVLDAPADRTARPDWSVARESSGARSLVLAAAAAALGVGVDLVLVRLGIGERLAVELGLPIVSPFLAAVVAAFVPVGAVVGAAGLEFLLRPEEIEPPAWARRGRGAIWQVAFLIALGVGLWRLLG